MAEEPVFDVTFSLVYVVAFIVVAILIFSFPFGFVPGTDLYAIRQYKCVDYLKKTKAFADRVRAGFIITDVGFENWRTLWQGIEEGIDRDFDPVFALRGLTKKTTSQVLRKYVERGESDRDVILQHYSHKP
jgi:hypothetical protein